MKSQVDLLDIYEKKYRALRLLQSEKYEKAAEILSEILIISPNSFDIWYYQAYSLFKLNRLEDVILATNYAKQSSQLASKALFQKGLALFYMDQFPEVKETINFIPESSRNALAQQLKNITEQRSQNLAEGLDESIKQVVKEFETEMKSDIEIGIEFYLRKASKLVKRKRDCC
jgi:tetratricopeptide (TPR) repeat protein